MSGANPRNLPRLKALLPGVKTPVLVLAGRDNPIVPPSNGELLAKHLPHCRHELLKCGHLIWEDAADTYAAQLADWLRGDWRRDGDREAFPSGVIGQNLAEGNGSYQFIIERWADGLKVLGAANGASLLASGASLRLAARPGFPV